MEITGQVSMLGFCSHLFLMRGSGAVADSLNNDSRDSDSTLRDDSFNGVLGFVVVWVDIALVLKSVAPIAAAGPVVVSFMM